MRLQESLDKLEKIITKNIDVYKKPQDERPIMIHEKKELGGALLKVELPVLKKVGRTSAREITKKYRIPPFSQLKRLTPIPGHVGLGEGGRQIFKDAIRTTTTQVFEEESIKTLENEAQTPIFIFSIDAFIDPEFLSKSKNVIYQDQDDNLQNFDDWISGIIDKIYYKDYNVLIKGDQFKNLIGFSCIKLASELDQTYKFRLSEAEKLRNEFEYNSVLHHFVKQIIMDEGENMPKLSSDLINRILSRAVLYAPIKQNIIQELEENYIYSQTKAWVYNLDLSDSFLCDVGEFSGLVSLLPALSASCVKEYPDMSIKRDRFDTVVKELNSKRIYINAEFQKIIMELSKTFRELFESNILMGKSQRMVDIPQLLKELDIEYDRFHLNISRIASQEVEYSFTKMLAHYNIKENQEDKSERTLAQRAKMLEKECIESRETQDTFLETGKFVSILSKSILLPLIHDNIKHIYQLLFTQKLRIQIDCSLMKDGCLFQLTNLKSSLLGDYRVVFDKSLQLLQPNLIKSLKRWTNPLECILPYKVFQSQPADFRYLDSLYSEIISESLSLIDSFNANINDYVLDCMKICSELPTHDSSVSDFCAFGDYQIEEIKKIQNGFRRKLVDTKKGIFDINMSHVSQSIEFALKSSLVHQEMRAKEFLNNRVLDIHKSYDLFFTIAEPVKFEQTQKASHMVKDLERSIPDLIEHINGNMKMKSFLDSRLWILNDVDVEKYYSSCTRLEELFKFRDLKKTQVLTALYNLRLGIGREIQMFMTLWRNVETAMNKLFISTSNHPKTPIILVEGVSESQRVQVQPLSDDQILSSLKYVIKHLSNTADIANIISKKIELLEAVPGTEEMEVIWKLMKDRTFLVQVLLASRNKLEEWMGKPVKSLEVDEIVSEAKKYIKVLQDSDLRDCWLVSGTAERLETFLTRDISTVKSLKNPILQKWHWEVICQCIGVDFNPEIHGIEIVVNTRAYQSYASFKASIDEVEAAANKERDIILSLSEISDRYISLSLVVVKESTKFHIIKSFDRHLSILESDLLAINTLKNTNGLEKFYTLFDELELKLEMAKLVLTNWEAVQVTMNSVSKFFLSGEVRLQLSSELRKYERIEAAYKSIILSAQTHKLLSSMIDIAPDLASSLMDMLQILRAIVANLQGWLDNKRLIFPRLFFVSDEELLDIVSVAKQPKKLQPYFSRLFNFTDVTVNITADKTIEICEIIGAHKEIISLDNGIDTKSLSAESWLVALQNEVQATLRSMFRLNLDFIQESDFSSNILWQQLYELLPKTIPKQVCLLLAQTMRTKLLETIIIKNPRAVRIFSQQTAKTILRLSELLSSNLKADHKWAIKNFLLYEIESRDFEQSLLNGSVSSLKDFLWISFPKYEMDRNTKNLFVRQYMRRSPYGFEYQGEEIYASNVFLPSNLAHNIWLASTQKYNINLQCADPAFSWQSYQAFSVMTGGFLFSIPCSAFITSKTLTKVMIGLAISGCYVRFQNLDHLKKECIDYIFQGLKSLKEILQNKKGLIASYLGRNLRLNDDTKFPCFITLSENPLMESDRLFFNSNMRQIVVSKPSISAVAKIFFLQEEFTHFYELGNQISSLFVQLSGILPKAAFYDFSSQSLKCLVRLAASFRRNSTEPERHLLVRALCFMYLPRILDSDKDSFFASVRSVFSGNSIRAFEDISNSIEQDPVSNLSVLIRSGHHLIVYGEQGSGKSQVINKVSNSLPSKIFFVNPSGLGPAALLGDFVDGTYLPSLFEMILNYQSEISITVIDGSFNVWIVDVINALLGDGQILQNGKTLRMGPNSRLILEMDDVQQLSPSTIGLFTLAYMQNDWSYDKEFRSWCSCLNNSNFTYKTTIPLILPLVKEYAKGASMLLLSLKTSLDERTSIQCLFSYLSTFFEAFLTHDIESNKSKIGNIIQYCVLWAIYPAVSHGDKDIFKHKYTDLVKTINPYSALLSLLNSHKSLDLFDIDYNLVTNRWETRDKVGLMEERVLFHSQLFIKANRNIVLMGPVGSGKSHLVLKMLKDLDDSFISFSTSDSPGSSIQSMQNFLNRVLVLNESNDRFMPTSDKRLVMFVDDVQFSLDGFDSTLGEFIYSLIDRQGYWSSTSNYRETSNVSFYLGADSSKNSGIPVLPRLLRLCVPILLNNEQKTLAEIIKLVKAELTMKYPENQQILGKITEASRELSQKYLLLISAGSCSPLKLFSANLLRILFQKFQIPNAGLNSDQKLINTWLLESQRIFRDRLNEPDQSQFDLIMDSLCTKFFQMNYRKVDDLEKGSLTDKTQLVQQQDTISFPDSADHFLRLKRILSSRNGYTILFGYPNLDISNVITQIVATKVGLKIHTFDLSPISFNAAEWFLFVKRRIIDAVIYNQEILAQVTICQFDKTTVDFWLLLNMFVNGLQFQGLWTDAEFDQLLTKMKNEMQKQKSKEIETIQDQDLVINFKDRISRNFKIVLSFDKRNKDCMRQLAFFSRIPLYFYVSQIRTYNETDFFGMAWSTFKQHFNSEWIDPVKLSKLCAKLFCSALALRDKKKMPKELLSPSVFGQFLTILVKDLATKYDSVSNEIMYMESNLKKINHEAEDLQGQRDEWIQESENLPMFISKVVEQIKSLQEVHEGMCISIRRIEKLLLEREQEYFNNVYEKEETALKSSLNMAKEQFELSIQFLHTIRKYDMDELKNYNQPPTMIAQLADTICIIFDRNPSWHEAKKIIISNTFIQKIANMDEACLTKSKIERLRKYTEQPNFCTDRMVTISVAAKALSQWVKTAVCYRWLKLHMSSSAQITAKIRKMCAARTNKTEEKLQLDILKKKAKEIEKDISSLTLQKKLKYGRLRIVTEALKEDSIFGIADDKNDEFFYRQWFQRGFSIGFGGNNDTSESYAKYQESMSALENLDELLIDDERRIDELLEETKTLFLSLTHHDLHILINQVENNPINFEAFNVFNYLFGFHQKRPPQEVYQEIVNMDWKKFKLSDYGANLKEKNYPNLFSRSAFYDNKMVTASAIAPYIPCKAALIIKDAAIKLMEVFQLSSSVKMKKHDAVELVSKRNSVYNDSWVANYENVSEFWTFEDIVHSFKSNIIALNPGKVMQELTAKYPGFCIKKALHTFSMVINNGTPINNMSLYVLSDSERFCAKVSKIELGHEQTASIIQQQLGGDVNQFLEQVEDEYIRLYVDILGALPSELSFRILFMLDHKSLVIAMQVCKKWYSLIHDQIFWKCLCYLNGWGLVFHPKEKSFDWRDFYQKMVVCSRIDFSVLKTAYFKDLEGIEGLQIYKKHNTFLRKTPEYIRLERHDNTAVEELLNFELSNHIFLQLEDFLTEFQDDEAPAVGYRIDTAKRIAQKNAVLRLRIMSITYTTTLKEHIILKHVHEILVEKGHKKNCINSNVHRMRKQKRGASLSATFEIDLPIYLTDKSKSHSLTKSKKKIKENAPDSFILGITNILRLISAYEYGILMGKRIHFNFMTLKSLLVLRESVVKRIGELKKDSVHLVGDIIAETISETTLKAFQASERTQIQALMLKDIEGAYPLSSSSMAKKKAFIISKSSEILNNYQFAQLPVKDNKHIFVDPDDILLHLLKLSGGYTISKEIVNDISSKKEYKIIRICDESMLRATINSRNFQNSDQKNSDLILITNQSHLSKISNVPVQVFNLSNDSNALEAIIFDNLFKYKGYRYFDLKKQYGTLLLKSITDLSSLFQKIMQQVNESTNIKDELRQEFISYYRLKLQEEFYNSMLIKVEVDHKRELDYFSNLCQFFASVVKDISWMKTLRKTNHISIGYLLNVIEESLKKSHNPNGDLAIENILENTLAVILEEIVNRFSSFDFNYISLVVGVRKLIFEGAITQDYGRVLLNVITKRIIASKEEYLKILRNASNAPENYPLISAIVLFLENSEKNSTTIEKIRRKFTATEKAIFRFALYGRFGEEQSYGIPDIFARNPLRRGSMESWVHFLSTRHQNIIFISTFRPLGIIPFLNTVFKKKLEEHIMFLSLKEEDKREKWKSKLESASISGDWVYVILDNQWIEIIPNIVKEFDEKSGLCKLWLICPFELQGLISDDIYPHISCANDLLEDREMYDLIINARVNYEKYLEQLCCSFEGKDLDASFYGVFIKTHFDLLSSVPKITSEIVCYDEFDLELTQRLLIDCSKKNLTFENTKKMIISGVYNRHLGNRLVLEEIDSLFDSNWKKFTKSANMNEVSLDKLSPVEYYHIWINNLKKNLPSSNIMQERWGTFVHKDVEYDVVGPYAASKALFTSARYSDVRHLKEDEKLFYDIFWYLLLSKTSNEYWLEICSLKEKSDQIWNAIKMGRSHSLIDDRNARNIMVKLDSLNNLLCSFPSSKCFAAGLYDLNTLISCLKIDCGLRTSTAIDSIQTFYSTLLDNNTPNFELKRLVLMNGQISPVCIPSIFISCKSANMKRSNNSDSCLIHLNHLHENHTIRQISFGADLTSDSQLAFEYLFPKASIDSVNELGLRLAPEKECTTLSTETRTNVTSPEIKSFFTVSIISTADVYNEREKVKQLLSDLQSSLELECVAIEFFDLCFQDLNVLAGDDIPATFENVLKRSHLHIFIFGGNLRSDNDTSNGLLLWDRVIETVCNMNAKPLAFVRESSFLRSVPKAYQNVFASNNDLDQKYLEQFKSKIVEIAFKVIPYTPSFSHIYENKLLLNGMDIFGEIFILQVKKWIQLNPKTDPLLPPVISHIPSRQTILNDIDDFLDMQTRNDNDNRPKIFCMYGNEHGQGKTTILKTVFSKYSSKFAILNNLMDVGYTPTNTSSLVESFCAQLSETLSADNLISVGLREDIWDGYLYLLKRAVFLGVKILILIDDVDKILADDFTNISWIPQMNELNTETWENIYFIVSSSSSQFFYRYFHGIYNKYIIQPIPSLTKDEKMDFLRSKIPSADDKDLLKIIQKPDGDQFMFLHFASKIIGEQDSMDMAVSINSIPDTIKNIFHYYISNIQAHFEKDYLKDVFLLLYFCRTGVLESEIIGMLKINFAQWLLLYRHLEPFLIRQKSGRLVLFNSYFAEFIKCAYVSDEKVGKKFEEIIGNYFWNLCDPEKHDSWDGSNLYRVKDILYHLLAAEAPLDTIISILCSLSFIRMIFKKQFGRHLRFLFSHVRKICARMNNEESLNIIYDFSLFVERNFQHLQNFPDLTFSLALSLPDRSCVSVRENALLWQKKQKPDTSAKIVCLSSILSIADTLVLGMNPCRIIFLSVLQFRGLGKCCVSVSDDGTIKLWDIDSYILIDTILHAPFSIGDISSCSFNLQPTDKIAYCHFWGEISIYSLFTKKPVIRITDSAMNSGVFFSNDKSGIWVSKFNSNGIHFVSFSGLTEKENKSISASKEVPLLLKCDRILAKSYDGAKVAIHSINYSGAIILNAVTVTEICRFNCEHLDEDSLACFSVSKDMFAAILSDHNIMVWKIDNHSRISYIKTDDLRFQDMAFSVDESMIYCGSSNGDIYMFNIHNGKMIRKVQTGSNGPTVDLICAASSNGKERVFLAADTKVMTCDIKSLNVSTVNNPTTEKLHSGSNIILLYCSQDLECEAQKYDALSVDYQGHISIWRGKDIFKSYCLDFALDTCAFEANNQIIFGHSSSHLIVYSISLKKILVNKQTPKSFSQLWIQYSKNHRVYWLGGLSNDELVCWKLSGKDVSWEMSDLFTKADVSFVPKKPIYIDFEKLCVRINGSCAVLNCWTGKEIFVHQNKRDCVKDMLLFERNGHVSSAILLSDSIYVDNVAWSSKTGIKSMDVLDQFCIDDHGEYLLYSGRIARPDADHENECIVNIPSGFINVIGLSPSRKRLCSLSSQGSFIKLWKMSANRDLVALTGDNVITIWNLQELSSSTEVPYISYPLSKSLSISSLNLSSYDSLIYLTCHGQVMVLRYVI